MSLRVAFIGFGRRGKTVFGYLHGRADVDVVAICDPVSEASFPAQNFVNSEKMLQQTQPDLVIIATPPVSHLRSILLCQRYKIPVICEKPMAVSASEAVRLKSMTIKLYAAYQLPFDPLISKAFLLGRRHKINRVFASQRVRLDKPGWRALAKQAGGGTLYDNGSHLVHLAVSQFGIPRKVFMTAKRGRSGTEYQADAVLTYSSFEFHIHVDWLSAIGKENSITIFTNEMDVHYVERGTQAELYELYRRQRSNWSELTKKTYSAPRGVERNLYHDPYNRAGKKDATEIMLNEFIGDLTNGALATSSRRWALDTIRVMDALYSSMRKGGVVNL